MMEVISRALKFTIRSEVCASRRMRSWMRLAMPRLAMMKSRVMGPGTPSVSPSPLAAPAPSSACASAPDAPEDEPATSCTHTETRYRLPATRWTHTGRKLRYVLRATRRSGRGRHVRYAGKCNDCEDVFKYSNVWIFTMTRLIDDFEINYI